MKKILTIVLALVLVLGLVPGFAVDQNPYDVKSNAAENLFYYRFIEGGTGGDLMLDAKLDRQQLATLICILQGKKEEAKEYKGPLLFKDAKEAANWAKPYIAYGASKGWLQGDDVGNYNPVDYVRGEELATLLLRVLGHEEKWGENIQRMAALGITVKQSNALLRRDVFDAVWPAVSLPVTKDGDILGVRNGNLKPMGSSETVEKPAKELLIDSVKAENLVQVMVKFNQPVAAGSLLKENFKLSNGRTVSQVIQQEDKTVVLLDLDKGKSFVNQEEYTLTAMNVQSEKNELKLEKVEKTFRVLDANMPEVVDAVFDGPKSLRVTFTEPIKQGTGDVQISTGNFILSANKLGIMANSSHVVIPLNSNLQAGKEYRLFLQNFEDFAGHKNINKELYITFATDTAAPIVSELSGTQEMVKVGFNKTVTGISPSNFYHTFSGYTPKAVTKDPEGMKNVLPTDKVSQIYVWFVKGSNPRPLSEGNVKFVILGNNGTQIKDLWGNFFTDQIYTVNVVADTEPPKVLSMKAVGNNKIEMIFSKPVDISTGNIKVTDLSGGTVPGLLPTLSGSGDKWTITCNMSMDSRSVLVGLSGVKDKTVSENKMPSYIEAVNFGDTIPPTAQVTYQPAGAGQPAKIFILYSEEVDPVTALEKNNYKIKKGSIYKTLMNAPVFYIPNNSVVIDLDPSEPYTNGDFILIQNVKDMGGQNIVEKDNKIDLHSSAAKPTIKEIDGVQQAFATGPKTLELHFDKNIASIDESKIKILDDQGNPTIIVSRSVDGSMVVKLETANVLQGHSTGKIKDTVLELKEGAVTSELGTSNNSMAPGTIKIVDKIAPQVVLNPDGTMAHRYSPANKVLTIEFDRSLRSLSLVDIGQMLAVDIAVRVNGEDVTSLIDGENTNVITGNNLLAIAFKEGAIPEQDQVHLDFEIKDSAKVLSAQAGLTALVQPSVYSVVLNNKAPEIQSVQFFNKATQGEAQLSEGDILTVTFTEPIKTKVNAGVPITDGNNVINLDGTNFTIQFKGLNTHGAACDIKTFAGGNEVTWNPDTYFDQIQFIFKDGTKPNADIPTGIEKVNVYPNAVDKDGNSIKAPTNVDALWK